MKDKLVSICIPTYNAGDFIEDTLNSIIGQTYQHIEIIIGDNASTDNTFEIVKKFQRIDPRIIYYRNEINLGYSGNCNKLISMSNGEYISIFHSDDIYDLQIVEKEVEVLNSNDDLYGVFSLYDKIDIQGMVIKKNIFPINSKEALHKVYLDEYIHIILQNGGSCFCCPTSMIRKQMYEKLGGYDLDLKYIEDQDMWARILLHGPMGIINHKLMKYRIHSKQGSSVYLDEERKDTALHLKHIKNFINQNSLEELYKDRLLKAFALDCISLMKLAVKKKNYRYFCTKLEESKKIYNLGYRSKIGLTQNLPSSRLSYITFYIWQSLLK